MAVSDHGARCAFTGDERNFEVPAGFTVTLVRPMATPSGEGTSNGTGAAAPKSNQRYRLIEIVAVVVLVLLLVLPLIGAWGLPYHLVCNRGSEIVYGQFWTPIVLVNAPFNGTASATGAITSDGEAVAGAAGSIQTSNGSSKGLFALAPWAIYSTSTSLGLGAGPAAPCRGSSIAIMAPIIVGDPTTGALVTPVSLAGSGSMMTRGVQTNFTLDGYRSVDWNMNYNTSIPPAANQTSCAPTSLLPVQGRLNITIPFQNSGQNAVVSSIQVFDYFLPPPGNWLIQNTLSGTWAFDYHPAQCE